MADSNKHTPSLRFPEFLNDGEWKEHTFSDVFTFVPNNTLSRANLNNENGSVQNIHYGDILIKFGEYLNVQTEHLPFISNVQDIERYRKAKLANGDVIIADTAEDETVGKCTELVGISDEFIVSGLHTIAVRPNNTFATGYLGFYMNSNSYREQLKRVMQGVKVLSVSKTAISQTRLRFPSSRIEQGRIADCLTFLDSYIYDTKSKLQQLKAHKRGLMQRLFPAKGKTVPTVRFSEFKNDGEWEEHAFSDIFTFIPNNTLSRANLNNENGSVQNIHYGDVLIKFRECLNVQNERLPFISDVQDIERYHKVRLVNGDVIIADTAEDETVGKCTELIGLAGEIIVPGLHTIAIRPNKMFASGYLGFYMNSNSYREQLTQIMQGIKVLSISKTAISHTKIRFPSSINEQEKIARSLSSINDEIKSYEDKITALELHKKGLMQQLFPKL